MNTHEKARYTDFNLPISVSILNIRLKELLTLNLFNHVLEREPVKKESYAIAEKGRKTLEYPEALITLTKEMLKFGSQVFGANVVDLISYRADIILTGYFLTAADVGYYTAAVGLSQFFWLIPNAIQRITYPATSEYWAKKNQDAIQVIVDKSMKYSACIMLPVALVAVFYGEEIITTLFGEKFIHAFAPLEVLLIGTVINGAVVRAIGSCMAGVGRPDINLKVVILSAVVGVGLNVVLIPYVGIVGAALATTMTLTVTSVLLIYFTIQVLGVRVDFAWFGKISLLTLASVAASRSLEGLHQYAVEATILCLYVAAILCWLLTKEDREYFRGLIRVSHFAQNSSTKTKL